MFNLKDQNISIKYSSDIFIFFLSGSYCFLKDLLRHQIGSRDNVLYTKELDQFEEEEKNIKSSVKEKSAAQIHDNHNLISTIKTQNRR